MSSRRKEKPDEKLGLIRRLRDKPEKDRPGSFSIAFQISVEQLVFKAIGDVAADLVYLFLISFAVLYNAELTALGSFVGLNGVSLSSSGGGLMERISTAELLMTSKNGSVVTADIGNYARFMFISVMCILIVQFIILVAACVIIPSRTYRRLKPLYNVAEAAKELKNIDINSDLEENGGNFEIHTGKEELAGLEEAVNDLLKRTISSYQSQIRFVSDASHELRTPIAVIKGYVNMLDRWGREDKEVLDESIESIKDEAENMGRLVENLLFLARGDSGRAVIRFEKLVINELICDIYDEFSMIDKDHEFRLDLRIDVEATADAALLKQCLRILVDNAVKYSPEGTDIILRLRERDERYYAIEVQDYGIGIKQEEVGKIFERFFRSDPARNRQSGGYGLGLSIAKWIADKHKGFFEVLSYENLGTRISLVLPYDEQEDGAQNNKKFEKTIDKQKK